MRVLWIVPGGVDRSGVERVIPVLLEQIGRLAPECELHVVALQQEPQPDSWPLLGATVHNLGEAPPRVRRQRLRQIVERIGRPDVIHAFWATDTADFGLWLKRRLRAPLMVSVLGGEVVWLPDVPYGGMPGRSDRRYRAHLLHGADCVTSASAYLDELLQPFGVEPARWVPGIDTAHFSPPTTRPAAPPWQLVHIASLNHVKGPLVMLEAMRRIVGEEPAARLQWIGFDTLDGVIQARAGELGLSGAITFAGWQPSEVVLDAFRSAHLHLMASYHEAGQVVALEAAACGVPTVGTAVGYLPDLHPDRAIAVPIGDATALAAETVALLRDSRRREAMGKAARAWAVENDAERSAARLRELYRGLVINQPSPLPRGD